MCFLPLLVRLGTPVAQGGPAPAMASDECRDGAIAQGKLCLRWRESFDRKVDDFSDRNTDLARDQPQALMRRAVDSNADRNSHCSPFHCPGPCARPRIAATLMKPDSTRGPARSRASSALTAS